MRILLPSRPLATAGLRLSVVAVLLLATFLNPGVLPAQDAAPKLYIGSELQLPGVPKVRKQATGAKLTLEPADAKAGDTVTLKITVTTSSDAYTYSMDPSFAGRTRIEVKTVAGLTAVDEAFSSDHKPKTELDPLLDQRVEKFPGGVTWSRRYRINEDAQPADVRVTGSLRYQICDASSCRPFSDKFDLTLAAEAGPPKYEFRHSTTRHVEGKPAIGPVHWTLTLGPEDAKPGDTVTLSVKATIDEAFHIFATDHDPKNVGKPTTIEVAALAGLKPAKDASNFQPDRDVELHDEVIDGERLVQRIHHTEIGWTRKFILTEVAEKDGFGISGRIDFQFCGNGSCTGKRFDYSIGNVSQAKPVSGIAMPVGSSSTSDTTPRNSDSSSSLFENIRFREPGGDSAEVAAEAGTTGGAQATLIATLISAFIGGLILNVMPCVLPVIAIKALSFAQQAGESRGRLLLLNVTYAAGVMTVFMLLASLGAFAEMSWGNLFQKTEFTVSMGAVVFAMGLSLLGVFELPIPGFIGAGAGSHQQEGLSGAFMTGVFATILATPCSGPFLGPIFFWTLSQSPEITYAVFAMMGLGLASPYLIFAVFPAAVKRLPKPGNWMILFKQIAGFVLIGTTIFLINPLAKKGLLVPALVLLLGIALGLWMVGNLYNLSSPPRRRWAIRSLALVMTGGISSFAWYLTLEDKMWQPFSEQAVVEALDDGRPVMVDFTADWCLTCKVVEKTTLTTEETRKLVAEHGIVTLKADWTDESDDIRRILNRLGADSIPVLAVFSPQRPSEPIVLRDLWTQATLHEEIDRVIDENRGPGDATVAVHSESAFR